MSEFYQKLKKAWDTQNSLVCVGLDPDVRRLPKGITGQDSIFAFNREIIDATADWVCAFKPQIAYYAAIAAEDQLLKSINYIHRCYPNIPVILDAKRGDIGATAEMYASESFERYQADAVTVNPYMGGDTLEPFLRYRDKGIIVLCRTSNPGSGDIQALSVGADTVSSHIARLAAESWNSHGNVGLVVGATYPSEIETVRSIVGDMPLLIPGVGAQGGDLEAVLRAGLDDKCCGLLVNASRSIIYASDGEDFAMAAQTEAKRLCRQVNDMRMVMADGTCKF